MKRKLNSSFLYGSSPAQHRLSWGRGFVSFSNNQGQQNSLSLPTYACLDGNLHKHGSGLEFVVPAAMGYLLSHKHILSTPEVFRHKPKDLPKGELKARDKISNFEKGVCIVS